MRNIHHHAHAVHFEHHLLAEIGEPVVVRDFGIVDVAGRVGPLVGIRPAQGHVANAQPVVVAEQMNVIFDRVAAFDSHQCCQLLLFVCALNVVYRECHHHAVRVARRLFIHRIDHVEGGFGEMPAGCFGVGPDRKEFRAQVAGASLVEADVPDILWISVADIETFVKKTLRSVSVGVHNDGGVVDGASTRADGLCKGKRRRAE